MDLKKFHYYCVAAMFEGCFIGGESDKNAFMIKGCCIFEESECGTRELPVLQAPIRLRVSLTPTSER